MASAIPKYAATGAAVANGNDELRIGHCIERPLQRLFHVYRHRVGHEKEVRPPTECLLHAQPRYASHLPVG